MVDRRGFNLLEIMVVLTVMTINKTGRVFEVDNPDYTGTRGGPAPENTDPWQAVANAPPDTK